MQINKDFYKLDFDSIPINPYWNVGDEIDNKMHRIHSYPAKFPAFITTKAIDYAKARKISINLIADIFCGCGTVAYETARNGKNFWGCDINPVATLIAKSKSHVYDDETISQYYDSILNYYSSNAVSCNIFDSINDRIKYWFKEEQIKDLFLLREAIFRIVQDEYYRNFFLCAFSNILKLTSVWLTKSIKPQVDPKKRTTKVLFAFQKQIKMMREANLENQIKIKTTIDIDNINFLEKAIDKPFADLVITSPPYVTSYEYADLHQLSTLWLEYTNDFKSFRQGTIGSLYHHSNFDNDLKSLNSIGESIVFQMYSVDKKKAKAVAKYFVDMQHATQKTYDLLNDNGMALFVIGNTEYKSVRIDNAKHLVESMFSAGFIDIEVCRRKISKKILTPYRDQAGKFTTDKSNRKIYSEEFIIIGKKQNG